MKKHLILVFTLALSIFAHGRDWAGFQNSLTNVTVNYNIGFTTMEKQLISQSVEINGVFILVNGGYNYEIGRDHKIYLGIGFCNAYQLQMGYGFLSNAFILRWRQDWGVGLLCFPPFINELFDSKYCSNKYMNKILDRLSFGYYIENKFIKGGFSAGIIVGIRLNVVGLYDYYVYKK